MVARMPNVVLIAASAVPAQQCLSMFGDETSQERISLPQMSYEDISLLSALSLGGTPASYMYLDFVLRSGVHRPSNLATVCFSASRLCRLGRKIQEANARSTYVLLSWFRAGADSG
jgi:hypothetical protein